MNIRDHAPRFKSRTQEYDKAHQAVLSNPYWFSDKPKLLSQTFSAENTKRDQKLPSKFFVEQHTLRAHLPTNTQCLPINYPSAAHFGPDRQHV
jgi:hypothetical protein